MNDFLCTYDLSESSQIGSMWVVTPEEDEDRVIAYYTVFPDPFELMQGILPPDPDFDPTYDTQIIDLHRIAVDLQYKNRGIGTRLLVRVISQIMLASESFPIKALRLAPLNPTARKWYHQRNFGFYESKNSPRYLYLTVETMKKTVPRFR